ncbi:hypothetical protein [Lacticaseibacillus zeae]|uniref:DUF1642 domain-containing protein n=1 Tax=Lacticaseibacillus zeae subsp. silagei TaxID=3068307 RepID=A0ABD7ZAG5_LACZE|nr:MULTISPECIES: hypothetical protein [Lacticaseibacillus]MDE3315281.1 hypothetical protein [Lacticaseibacillus zeae]WLV83687.1 hypothetical protein LACZS2_000070 [Lacticaseibacillus sp. NCIMB 15475]WLV86443.1 hypothetical protein LACZS1_000070 [Lacticaseibacillus sp. NCIMB 15474]
MSNETKQDVFDAVWNRLASYQVFFNGWPRETFDDYKKRYDAALPDDLPVIPEAVGDVIVKLKHKKFSLSGAMSYAALVSLSPWMTFEHEDTFALAWVLGVWRVEETGEIVKLEAEK